MKRAALWLLLLAGLPAGGFAQTSRSASASELQRILGIQVWHVRKPVAPHRVWSIEVLRPEDLKPAGEPGAMLTRTTFLVSLRPGAGTGENEYQFLLPQQGDSLTSGKLNVCGDLACGAQIQIAYFAEPRYSKDGTQCVLGRVTALGSEKTRFITLVAVSDEPQNEHVRNVP